MYKDSLEYRRQKLYIQDAHRWAEREHLARIALSTGQKTSRSFLSRLRFWRWIPVIKRQQSVPPLEATFQRQS